MTFDKSQLLSLVEKSEASVNILLDHLAKETTDKGGISVAKLDCHQVLAYDVVWMKSELAALTRTIVFADKTGFDPEKKLALFFTGDVLADVANKMSAHAFRLGLTQHELLQTAWNNEIVSFITDALSPSRYEKTADLLRDKGTGNYGLTEDQTMIRDTFKKFAEDKVWPVAEKVHRQDLLIPQEIINGLKELGSFGLSIPQRYGGFQDDAKPDNMGMVIVTEELSRGSLGLAGSLITRPEILSKALLKGGTEEQKQKWLPLLASGEKMVAVAVTEPDYGSDVASIKVTAIQKNGGWVINGAKTWCTFAGYADTLMVLVRTDPD